MISGALGSYHKECSIENDLTSEIEQSYVTTLIDPELR